MILRLPDLVGSPLSVNALREDLQVAHNTAAGWLDAIERLVCHFPHRTVRGTAHPGRQAGAQALPLRLVSRAGGGSTVRESRGVPLAQMGALSAGYRGARFRVRFFRDVDGGRSTSWFSRTGDPSCWVECKLADRDIDRGLRYLKARFPSAKAFQIALSGTRDFVTPDDIRAMPAVNLLRTWI